MLLAYVFFLLPGSAIWEAKAKQNTEQQRGGNSCYSSRFLSTSEQISWHCRGTEGHRKTTKSSVRLLENCPIMVSACWGYMLWYRLVQVPLMLWRHWCFLLTAPWELYPCSAAELSGECLSLETPQVWDVLILRHWVTQWRSWRKMCTRCVLSSGKMKRRLSESSLKISRDNSLSHTKQQRRNSLRPWSNKKWRFTLKMEKAGSLWVLVSASLADLQLQKTF